MILQVFEVLRSWSQQLRLKCALLKLLHFFHQREFSPFLFILTSLFQIHVILHFPFINASRFLLGLRLIVLLSGAIYFKIIILWNAFSMRIELLRLFFNLISFFDLLIALWLKCVIVLCFFFEASHSGLEMLDFDLFLLFSKFLRHITKLWLKCEIRVPYTPCFRFRIAHLLIFLHILFSGLLTTSRRRFNIIFMNWIGLNNCRPTVWTLSFMCGCFSTRRLFLI